MTNAYNCKNNCTYLFTETTLIDGDVCEKWSICKHGVNKETIAVYYFYGFNSEKYSSPFWTEYGDYYSDQHLNAIEYNIKRKCKTFNDSYKLPSLKALFALIKKIETPKTYGDYLRVLKKVCELPQSAKCIICLEMKIQGDFCSSICDNFMCDKCQKILTKNSSFPVHCWSEKYNYCYWACSSQCMYFRVTKNTYDNLTRFARLHQTNIYLNIFLGQLLCNDISKIVVGYLNRHIHCGLPSEPCSEYCTAFI